MFLFKLLFLYYDKNLNSLDFSIFFVYNIKYEITITFHNFKLLNQNPIKLFDA